MFVLNASRKLRLFNLKKMEYIFKSSVPYESHEPGGKFNLHDPSCYSACFGKEEVVSMLELAMSILRFTRGRKDQRG